MAATLEEIEARVAALEAERADYRAVLTAINALGANQREHSERLNSLRQGQDELRQGQDELRQGQDALRQGQDALRRGLNALGANQREHSERLSAVDGRLSTLEGEVRRGHQDASARFRSLEESNAEIKDLLVRALDRE